MLITLSHAQILERVDVLSVELDQLLGKPTVATKRNARQWQFFRFAFEVLTGNLVGDFPCDAKTAAQYKHEVTKKLAHYYGSSRGPAVIYRFGLIQREQALSRNLVTPSYPSSNGYVVTVEHWIPESRPDSEREVDVLERAVMNVMTAEWNVYLRVPHLDLSPLRGKVVKGSQLYKRISGVAERCSRRGWTISNPGNPSNMRLLDIQAQSILPTRAEVSTKEYWLLEWWSLRSQQYEFFYRETNHQTYVFVRQGPRWIATDNDHPPPQISVFRTPFA